MRLSTILKLLASALLLAFLASRMDLATLARVLVSARLPILLAALSIQVSNFLISVIRWREVLVNFGIFVPYSQLARLTFIGNFFSLFLPSSIGGDFVRAFYLARRENRGMPTTLTSTLMERSGGLFALLLIGIAASLSKNLVVHNVSLIWLFLGLLGAYVAASVALFNRRLHSMASRLLQRFHLANVENKIELVSRGLTTLIGNARAVSMILGTSLLIQFLSVVMVWTCSRALGIVAPFSAFLIFVPLINLSIMVPLTINGFGLRESLYFLLFTQIGVNEEQAVALSLVNALVIMVAAFPGGIFYSLYKKSGRLDPPDQFGLKGGGVAKGGEAVELKSEQELKTPAIEP